MNNNNKIKVESLDDSLNTPAPSEGLHVPRVHLPQNENNIPKVNVTPIVEATAKVTLPSSSNVVLPTKTPEPSSYNVSQETNENKNNFSKSTGNESKSLDFNNKKKVRKFIIIGFVFLFIIFIFLLAYSNGLIFSSKEKNSDVDKSNEPGINKIPVDINSVEVVSMFSKFKISNNCLYNTELLNSDNLVRLRIAYENIDVKYFINASCSNTSCNMNPEHCGESITQEMKNALKKHDLERYRVEERKNITKTISAKILEDKYKELFGSDSNVVHESFGIGGNLSPSCRLMKYESDTSTYYYYNSDECNNNCSVDVHEKIIESYKIDDNLFVVSSYNSGNTRYNVIYEFRVDPKTQMYVFKNATKK